MCWCGICIYRIVFYNCKNENCRVKDRNFKDLYSIDLDVKI